MKTRLLLENPDAEVCRRHFFLSLRADHEKLIAFALIMTTFPGAFVAFIIYPILNFGLRLMRNRRIEADTEAAIRDHFNFSKSVLVRRSKKQDSYMVSLPFVATLYLSDEVLSDPLSDESKAIISHELGHVRQYDQLVIQWSVISGSIWLYIAARYGIPSYVSQLQKFDLHHSASIGNLWMLYMILFPLLSLTFIYRQFHGREFLADTRAYSAAPNETTKFLKRSARREKYQRASSPIQDLRNELLHPTFVSRLERQTTPYTTSLTSLALRHILWSFTLAILLSFFRLIESGEGNTFSDSIVANFPGAYFPKVSILMLLIAAGFIGVKIDRCINEDNDIVANRERVAIICSYAIGIIGGYSLIRSLEYFLHGNLVSYQFYQWVGVPALSLAMWLVATTIFSIIAKGSDPAPGKTSATIFAWSIYVGFMLIALPLATSTFMIIASYSTLFIGTEWLRRWRTRERPH